MTSQRRKEWLFDEKQWAELSKSVLLTNSLEDRMKAFIQDEIERNLKDFAEEINMCLLNENDSVGVSIALKKIKSGLKARGIE